MTTLHKWTSTEIAMMTQRRIAKDEKERTMSQQRGPRTNATWGYEPKSHCNRMVALWVYVAASIVVASITLVLAHTAWRAVNEATYQNINTPEGW